MSKPTALHIALAVVFGQTSVTPTYWYTSASKPRPLGKVSTSLLQINHNMLGVGRHSGLWQPVVADTGEKSGISQGMWGPEGGVLRECASLSVSTNKYWQIRLE